MFAENLIVNHRIPKDHFPLLAEQTYLKERFEKGKQKFIENKNIAKKQQEEANRKQQELDRVPRSGYPIGKDLTLYSLCLAAVRGDVKHKRKLMLKSELDDLNKLIKEKEKNIQGMRDLPSIVAMSAAQTPTRDWAIEGGIASAIGGPAAGIAAASDAMAENRRIEEENARNRRAAASLGADMHTSLYGRIEQLENEKEEIIQKRNMVYSRWTNTNKLVVFDSVSTETLYNSLSISNVNVQHATGNTLKVSVTIQNKYEGKEFPNTVQGVVDGTLIAQVYFDDIYLGDATLVLPTLGINCKNGIGIAKGIYLNKVAYTVQGRYHAKIIPNKLWLTEQ